MYQGNEIFHPVAVTFFAKSVFWERSQEALSSQNRGTSKNKKQQLVHLYRSMRQMQIKIEKTLERAREAGRGDGTFRENIQSPIMAAEGGYKSWYTPSSATGLLSHPHKSSSTSSWTKWLTGIISFWCSVAWLFHCGLMSQTKYSTRAL